MNEALRRLNAMRPIDLGAEAEFALGALTVHPATRQVSAGQLHKTVEPRVMQVLVALARANGAVVSRDQLIERCWGGRIVGDDAINSCLAKVRALAALTAPPAFEIETIPRVGYRLAAKDVKTAAGTNAAPAPLAGQRPARTTWRPALLVAAAVLIALALPAAFWLLYRSGFIPSHAAHPKQGQTTGKPSIAVLPFRNLSAGNDAAYFADGIQDEILTRLAKIGALKVISRTSTEAYAGKTQNLRQIAKQLGVDNVLEGNVQREGNRVRINVQLIRASSDSHLWAEDYDRTLDDIFSAESEVARTIAATLAARLTGRELQLLNTRPTSNPKAYDSYLRGLVWMDKPLEPGGPEKAAAALEQAVRADPGFALAWAKLSTADAFLAFGDEAKRLDLARQALKRAKSLGPQLPETEVASAFFTYYGERDYRGALKEFEALRRRWPNNVEVLRALGLLSRRVGRAQDAVGYFQEALALDPHNVIHYTALIDILDGFHRFPEALKMAHKALAIWPRNPELLSWKGGVLQDEGQVGAAAAVLARVPESVRLQVIALFTTQYLYERRYADGARYLERTLARPGNGREMQRTAHLLMHTGDLEARAGQLHMAKEHLTKARDLWLEMLKTAPRDTGFLQPLAYTYADLQDRQDATAIADRCIADYPLARDSIEGVNCLSLRAVVAARFNERALAVSLLKQISTYPWSPSPASLRLDPNYDSLRGDPEFEKLAHADGK